MAACGLGSVGASSCGLLPCDEINLKLLSPDNNMTRHDNSDGDEDTVFALEVAMSKINNLLVKYLCC